MPNSPSSVTARWDADRAARAGVRLHRHARVDVDREESLAGADVAIEFSVPAAVLGNIEKVSALHMPIVIGTTGWLEHLAEAKASIETNNSALVWSPNFSIGVNVFCAWFARPPAARE